jgi:hypothetical protein
MEPTDVSDAVVIGWSMAVIAFTVIFLMRSRALRHRHRVRFYPYSYYRLRRGQLRRHYVLTLAVSILLAFMVDVAVRASL